MTTKNDILASIDSPKRLEELYLTDPDIFIESFEEAFKENPDSLILQIWFERLHYSTTSNIDIDHYQTNNRKYFLLAVIVGTFAGVLTILPAILDPLVPYRVYDRNIALLILLPLLLYFGIKNLRKPKHIVVVSSFVIGIFIFLNCFPNIFESDTELLSTIAAPFFFWMLIGFAFCAENWTNFSKRNDYLNFSGKLIFLSSVFYLCWLILLFVIDTFITLFTYYDYFHWAHEYMIFGLAVFPTITAHLIESDPRFRFNILALLSRIFIPFVFVVEVLLIILINIKYQNLITIQDLLFVSILFIFLVLILTILSISDRAWNSPIRKIDFATFALIGLTLITGVILFVSFLLKISISTLSPAFITGIGSYFLLLAHLAGLFDLYIKRFRHKVEMKFIHQWTAKLMPIYASWLIFILIGLPIIFGFSLPFH